jgi:hypothetical protein
MIRGFFMLMKVPAGRRILESGFFLCGKGDWRGKKRERVDGR